MFNDPNVVMQKPEVCRLLMSKVLYLLVVEGETLTTNEVTDVFFGATKLFQNQDVGVRSACHSVARPSPHDVPVHQGGGGEDLRGGGDHRGEHAAEGPELAPL